MAEQEIQDLKQRSVADRERMARSDAAIQDLTQRYEAMAKKMETLEKMKWRGMEIEENALTKHESGDPCPNFNTKRFYFVAGITNTVSE